MQSVLSELGLMETMQSQPFNFPFDLIARILPKLPVKPLMRFRSVSKSFDALISDPKFAKKQFHSSAVDDPTNPRNHLIVTFRNPFSCLEYSLPSVFGPASATWRSHEEGGLRSLCGSCHGVLCVGTSPNLPIIWNPSIGKFKHLPFIEPRVIPNSLGLGYDHGSESYKVVAVNRNGYAIDDVKVLTLGTDDSWRPLPPFPRCYNKDIAGKFVSGTLNWLAMDDISYRSLVVSIDLGTEMHQRLSLPPAAGEEGCDGVDVNLAVLKGCLCILSHSNTAAFNVWLMRDFGNNQSWTKFCRVPYFALPSYGLNSPDLFFIKPLCISGEDDDEILFDYEQNLVVYSCKSGTFNAPPGIGIQKSSGLFTTDIYSESLLSPWS